MTESTVTVMGTVGIFWGWRERATNFAYKLALKPFKNVYTDCSVVFRIE
jgi:hypothetical protein